MSPQCYDRHHTKREIHGRRFSPLKVNKESHQIHKPSSSSSSSSSPSSLMQQRQPVIIYTHSPKVIHTHAHDFMALVQKLTGLSSSNTSQSPPASPPLPLEPSAGDIEGMSMNNSRIFHEDSTSSYLMNDDNFGDIHLRSSAVSPIFQSSDHLFSGSPFFCSPWHFYRYADPVVLPPTLGNSHNALEAVGAFPNYLS